jgi:hypothetical protein
MILPHWMMMGQRMVAPAATMDGWETNGWKKNRCGARCNSEIPNYFSWE